MSLLYKVISQVTIHLSEEICFCCQASLFPLCASCGDPFMFFASDISHTSLSWIMRGIRIKPTNFGFFLTVGVSLRNEYIVCLLSCAIISYLIMCLYLNHAWIYRMHIAMHCITLITNITLTAKFMGPTWGASRADRIRVGPMLAP